MARRVPRGIFVVKRLTVEVPVSTKRALQTVPDLSLAGARGPAALVAAAASAAYNTGTGRSHEQVTHDA